MKRFSIALLIAFGLFTSSVIAQQIIRGQQTNGFINNLFTVDLVMRFASNIDLSDKQKEDIKEAYKATEATTVDIRWDMREETGKLVRLSDTTSIDANEILDQANIVMTLEKDMKLAQLGLLVKVKNILTPEQQEQLKTLRRRPRFNDEVAGRFDILTPEQQEQIQAIQRRAKAIKEKVSQFNISNNGN